MLTPCGFDEPVVLELADYQLPAISEPPDGVIIRRNVWLRPGLNGLYDATGEPILESFLRRGFDLNHFPHGRPESVAAATLEATAALHGMEKIVYVPYARITHFGHRLTEFAGNLGAILEHPEGLDGIGGPESVLVVPVQAASSRKALVKLLRLPATRVLSTASLVQPVRVQEAVIPLPSMMNRHGIARRHFGRVRRLLSLLHGVDAELAALAEPDRGEKLYLSRSRLPPKKRLIHGEADLEQVLATLGWRVVYPEQLSLGEQLLRLAAARTVAGALGSALHLLMAFGESSGQRRLIALGGPSPNDSNPNVALQAARQGIPFRHVVCLEPDPFLRNRMRFMNPSACIAARLDALALDLRW